MSTAPHQEPSSSESQPLLSIIIPVYNVAPYLRRCLDSLLRQDYTHLEILCVDDGSKDDSLAILREYELMDKRVRVAHQENSGTATARNVALAMASGDWVTCVDPDDYMLPGAYSTLMKHATSDVDVVIFGMRVETTFDSMKSKVSAYQSYMKLDTEGYMELNANYTPDGNTYLCNKLYRRSIIEKHQLRLDPEVCVCEDKCWHMRFCAYARAAYVHPGKFYVYDLRESSTMFGAKNYARWVHSFLHVFDNVVSTYRQEGILHEYLPWFERLVNRTQADVFRWAFPAGTAVKNHSRLLELIRKHHLQDEPTLLRHIHEMEEQQGAAILAQEILREACAPAVDNTAADEAMHLAIPTDEAHVGLAALLAQSIKLHATGPVCVHIVCDDMLPSLRNRLLQMTAPNSFELRIHVCDSRLLHKLPPLEEGSYAGYLKMALPQILPQISRVLVLSPGLVVTGDLPAVEAVEMEGKPLAVSLDWPVEGTREQIISAVEMRHYVSRDVMLMDLTAMREAEGGDAWLAACMLRPFPLPEPEQNSLNLTFQNRMAFLADVTRWLSKATIPSEELDELRHSSHWYDAPVDMLRMRAHRAAKPAARPEPPAPTPQAPPSAMLLAGQYGTLLKRYWYCKVMAKLTWGKKRRHYKERRRALRQLLRDIRTLSREALHSRGISC